MSDGIGKYINVPKEEGPKGGTGTLGSYFKDTPSPSGLNFGRGTSVNLKEYLPYMPAGVNTDFNIDKQRAQNQGFGESLAKGIGNTIANTATGMIEMLGYAGSLVTEWGDDRDYSNILTRTMQQWHNPFGEVYRENPNQVWDMGDSAWWINSLGQLAESAAAFALPGGEVAKLFEGMTRAAASSLELGKLGTGVVKGAGQLASAALMGYAEGAMSGYRIYDQAYNTQLQNNIDQGLDPVEADKRAKQVAADAASSAVQLYTKLGAVLNLTAFSPIFRRADDEAHAWLSTEGRQKIGESTPQWKARIQAAGFDNKDIAKIFSPRSGISGYASEMFQEGSEEFIQNYFDKIGEEKGKGVKVKTGLAAIGDFFDKTMDSEGALNFALGALGGGAQTVILDNLPLHRVQTYGADNNPLLKVDNSGQVVKDAKGEDKFQTQLVSSRTREFDKSKRYFSDVKDAIVKDITWFEGKNAEMVAEKDPVKKEQIRAQMFNVGHLNAVTQGLSGNWKQQYKEIEHLDNEKSLGEQMQPQIDEITQKLQEATQAGDPVAAEIGKQRQALLMQQSSLMDVTEAMQRGFAKNRTDNHYKQQAQEAVADLDYLQKTWDATQKKYGATDEQKSADLASYVFAHQADLYQMNKILQHHEAEHARLQGEYEVQHAGISDDFDFTAQTYQADFRQAEYQLNELEKDLKTAGEVHTQEKYHGIDETGLVYKLTQEIKRLRQKTHELNDNLKMSFDASPWALANPGKKFDDYFKALSAKFNDREDLDVYKAQIENHRVRTSALNTKLNQVISQKGMLKAIKVAIQQKRDLVKEMEVRNKKDNTDALLNQRSDTAARKLQKHQLSVRERDIREQIKAIEERIAANTKKLHSYEKDVADIKKKTSLWAQLHRNTDLDDLKTRVRDAKYDIAVDNHRLADLKTELGQVETAVNEVDTSEELIDTPPPPEDLDHEEPTGDASPADEVSSQTPVSETEYEKALKLLPFEVRIVFNDAELEFKAGKPFSWDRVFNHTIVKLATANPDMLKNVNKALVAMKTYIDGLPKDVNPVPDSEDTNTGTEEDSSPIPDGAEGDADVMTSKDAPKDPVSDMLVTRIPLTNVPDSSRRHEGKKPVNSGTIIANATLQSMDYIDTAGNYRQVAPNALLNPNTHKDILSPSALGPGTKLTLRTTEYTGTVNTNERMNETKFQDYRDFFDENGDLKTDEWSIGNVPIGIYNPAGELIGYLPTQDRISARYAGATNLRNTAEESVEGNEQVQLDANMKLRRQIADSTAPVEVDTLSKGPGSVIKNYRKDGETYRPTKKPARSILHPEEGVLPDTSLKFGIMSGGNVYENKNDPTEKALTLTSDQISDYSGSPVALLPMANGEYEPALLFMPRLYEEGGDETAVNSIIKAIEIFLGTATEQEKKDFAELSGLDVETADGLRTYIRQNFTHLNPNFDATHTLADKSMFPDAKQEFLFNVARAPGEKGVVMLGVSYSGKKPLYARANNLPQFRDALKKGLMPRWKSVAFTDAAEGIQGINSPRPFNEVFYHGGKWQSTTHPNYNEYVKAHATTYVNGQNQKDGKYVYAANPVIELDMSTVKVPAAVKRAVLVKDAGAPNAPVSEVHRQELEDWKAMDFSSEAWWEGALKLEQRAYFTTYDQSKATLTLVNPSGKILNFFRKYYQFKKYENPNVSRPDQVYHFDMSVIPGIDKLVHDINNEQFENRENKEQLRLNGLLEVQYIMRNRYNRLIDAKYGVKSSTAPATEQVNQVEEEDVDDVRGFSGYSAPSTTVQTIVPDAPGFSELSFDLLQKLHNFTPAGERNGKTPGQVMVEMLRAGIPYIAEGHNPFTKCS